MKKHIIAVLAVVLVAFALTACNNNNNQDNENNGQDITAGTGGANSGEEQGDTPEGNSEEVVSLVVGATAVPHAEMLEFVQEELKEAGVDLTITIFDDYPIINKALYEEQIDANFFQHIPYLESYVADSGHELIWVGKTHIEPMGIYPGTVKSLEDLAEGSLVAIPDDPTNEARALLLLEAAGLITLKEGAGFNATPADVEDNPKGLEFSELAAAMLPRTLDSSAVAVINTNYALQAGLEPYQDSLYIEEKDSPYANVVAVRAEDESNPAIIKLVEALTSDKMRDFLLEQYEGALVPSF